MSGGIAFGELDDEQVFDFQENLIRTMTAIEDTYFRMAEKSGQNCLIICDRGVMDASAYMAKDQWNLLLEKLQLSEMNICEDRYDHVVHMVYQQRHPTFIFTSHTELIKQVSAASGAEDFYTVEDHAHRFEGLELARERDSRLREAWKMHPYVDLVDNNKEFGLKVLPSSIKLEKSFIIIA